MTTIEKLNAIPKVVYVTREQYGMPEYDIDYGDFGFAAFKLDLSMSDEHVLLAYYQNHMGETYELWCVRASIYDNDGDALTCPTIGDCLERCLDETIEHFTKYRNDYSYIETYSGYSYDEKIAKESDIKSDKTKEK